MNTYLKITSITVLLMMALVTLPIDGDTTVIQTADAKSKQHATDYIEPPKCPHNPSTFEKITLIECWFK